MTETVKSGGNGMLIYRQMEHLGHVLGILAAIPKKKLGLE